MGYQKYRAVVNLFKFIIFYVGFEKSQARFGRNIVYVPLKMRKIIYF